VGRNQLVDGTTYIERLGNHNGTGVPDMIDERLVAAAVPIVVAVACAAATGIGQAGQTRPGSRAASTTPATLNASFGVFRKAPTREDALPAAFSGWVASADGDPALRDLDVADTRLAAETDETRVYLAPRGDDGVCMLAFAGAALTGIDCAPTRSAANPSTPISSGGRYLNVLVPDVVRGVRATSRGGAALSVVREGNVAMVDDSSGEGVDAITLVGEGGAPLGGG
jgi:hypothetical protein